MKKMHRIFWVESHFSCSNNSVNFNDPYIKKKKVTNGLNSEFYFSLTSSLNNPTEASVSYCLLIAVWKKRDLIISQRH